MRQKVIVPTNGSSMILKASSAIGSLSEDLRSTSLPLRSTPFTGGTSPGRGRKTTTASSSRRTPFVLERGAAQDREERAGDSSFADEPFERGDVGFFTFEVSAHHLVIELDRGLDQLLTVFLGLLGKLGRNFDVVIFGAKRLIVPN